jgi:hypothetical protein
MALERRMLSQFFKCSSEDEARRLCPHVAAALDVLRDEYSFRVEHVGWENPKSPELVLTLDKKIPTEALQRIVSDHLLFNHETFSFKCTEHFVSVWSGR